MHTCRPTSGNRHGVLFDSGGPTRHIREFSSSGFTQRNSFSRLEWAWDGGRWVYLKGIPSPGSGSVHTPSTTPSYPGSDISWSQSRGRARGDEKIDVGAIHNSLWSLHKRLRVPVRLAIMRLAWSTFDRPKASRADVEHLSNEPTRSWGPKAGRGRKSCRRLPAQPAWHRSTWRKLSVDNCQHWATMVGGKATGPYLAQGLLWPWANYAYRARVCVRAALEPFPHGQEAAPE